MSVSNDLPTMDSLCSSKTPVFSSMDMLKVRWRPFGSMQSTIEVAEDLDASTNSCVPPYQLTTGINRSFHQISTSPATDPPVSSITVQITDLEDWAWRWTENHEDCDDEHQEWVGEDGNEDDEEEESLRKLVRCCDQNRPQAPPPLLVCPTSQTYVIVHDYIGQVHAWIESLQFDIIAVAKENDGTRPSTPRYTLYFVWIHPISETMVSVVRTIIEKVLQTMHSCVEMAR